MLLYCLFSIFCLCSYGQLRGSFNYGQDNHIYFYLSNPTAYSYNVFWGVYNYSKYQSKNDFLTMTPNSTYAFGPNIGWTWLQGEKFALTVNGQTTTWTCPQSDPSVQSNPSFGGSGDWIPVSVNVSKCKGSGGSLCSCKVYRGYKRAGLNQYKGNCQNIAGGGACNHGPAAHGLSEY